MRLFAKLFGGWLQYFYHCFDRVVLNGYLFFFHREANVVWFFREVIGQEPTKEALCARSRAYVKFVEGYARKHHLAMEWAPAKTRKEDLVARQRQAAQSKTRFGVYAILMSKEVGPTFRCVYLPCHRGKKHWLCLKPQRSQYRHYYFYINDPQLGACCLRVGAFLPFVVTAWINGHEFVARRLERAHQDFKKNDNAIVACGE